MGSSLKTVAQSLNSECCTTNQTTDVVCNISTRKLKQNDTKYFSSSSEDEKSQIDANDTIQDDNDAADDLLLSDTHTAKINDTFKISVEKRNESLIAHYIKEYPSFNFITNAEWKNGDKCLHVAVKNKFYGLITFLISNGASVK